MRKTPQYCQWNCSCVQNTPEPATDCEQPSSRCSDPRPRRHSGPVPAVDRVTQELLSAKTPASAISPIPPPTPLELPPEIATAHWPPANLSRNAGDIRPGSKLKCPSPASCPHSTTAAPLRYRPAAKKSANGETIPLPAHTETPAKIPGLSRRAASSA